MVDIATLAIAIDATPVKAGVAELDKLTTAGARAEGAVDRLGDTAQQTGEQMRGAGRGAAEMAREAQRAAASSGSARQGVQQLGYQLNDVATMFASGANAAQIFGSQLGQTVQAVQLMAGGTSRLASFLAGPWGIALSTAAIAITPFIGRLFESEGAAKDAANAYRTAADEARGLAGAMNAMKLNDAQMKLNKLTDEKFKIETTTIGPGMGEAGRASAEAARRSQEQRLLQIEQESLSLRNVISLAQESNQRLAQSVTVRTAATSAVQAHTSAVRASSAAIKEEAVSIQSAMEELSAFKREMQAVGIFSSSSVTRDITRKLRADTGPVAQDMAKLNLELTEFHDKNTAAAMAANAAATESWNDRLRETINLLDGLGGAGSTLANIGAIFEALGSGGWGNVRGRAGVIGQALFTSVGSDGKRFVNELGQKFQSVLDGVFGGQGSFTKVLQGAGTGLAISQTLFGNKKGSNIGGAIGGALGSAVAGPLGSVVGSIIGGAIGSAFNKVSKGYAVVSNTGVTTGGNNADLQASSKTSGSGIQGAIQTIADQLGGTVGNYAVSIGKRSSGYIRVSASGSSRVADKSFAKNGGADLLYDGKDEAEALRIAILNAIQDGAIQGIRAGTQALLSKQGDIEAQLAKALKFEGVFTALKAETDPLGAALDSLNKKFADLRAIFTEAGASAAEFAQIEQLLAIERAKAAEQAQQAIVDRVRDSWNLEVKLLDLLGKNESALAASRLLELASMKATLQPLQAMIYQLEDAQGIIEKFGPLADDLKKFRAELLGGGDAAGSFGFVQAQFRSTAAAAALGDPTALGGLRSAANTYLTSARNNAGSALDYQRALGEVLSAVDRGIFAADTQVDYAQAQIDAINNSANIMERMRSELVTLQGQIAVDSETMRKLLQRFENDGVTISDATAPLQVQVVS